MCPFLGYMLEQTEQRSLSTAYVNEREETMEWDLEMNLLHLLLSIIQKRTCNN